MTLPSISPNNQCDDDSDMFGPPRTSPPTGHHHIRSRVPMISPKLRQREERKRILQLCAHKLERIKDSETNLRRSVCINNTYCRLTDELRREKQNRYLENLPRTDLTPETAKDNTFNPFNSCGIENSNHQPSNRQTQNDVSCLEKTENSSCILSNTLGHNSNDSCCQSMEKINYSHNINCNSQLNEQTNSSSSSSSFSSYSSSSPTRKRPLMSSNIVNDLEILDRELSAINSPMPLIDPEITQGAEQLEKAISSRKRQRSEDESDRLVREALSQFYIPPQRLISAIDDCPLDIVNVGSLSPKRQKMSGGSDLELDFDLNQNQKEFEVIMDALRLGSPSPTASVVGSDSCGQAAMMSESSNVFHNLVVTSLET